MKILMRILSEEEVLSLLSNGAFAEGLPCVSALLPSVVLQAAQQNKEKGLLWFWCAPRLFINEATGQIVGSGSFFATDVDQEMEIGYGTDESCQHKGVATQGISLMLASAYEQDPCVIITAKTSISNPASKRVLEKNEFRRCGSVLDPEDGPLDLWRKDPAI